MTQPKKIEFVVERTGTGFSAYATDHDVYTVGETMVELKANMVEALNLHFESSAYTENDVQVTLDLPQFFDFYKVINAKALAGRIGMSQSLLSQYVNGIKKPSPKQTNRILEGVRAVGQELASMQFA